MLQSRNKNLFRKEADILIMKRFHVSIIFMLMALTAFIFSGCGGGDDNNSPAKDKLMVLTSKAFELGESYKLYRGDKVGIRGTDARYYVAPIDGDDLISLNLEFRDSISDDVPFVITKADNDSAVVFAYNPAGITEKDTTTEYGSIIRFGGGTQQLKYTGLNVAGTSASSGSAREPSVMASAIYMDTSEEIIITLNGTTASIESTDIPEYDFIWHADPNHRDEYFTYGTDTEELTESEMNEQITSLMGVYIARDIRYTPSNISFSGTAKKDEDTEYVSYYSDSVAKQAAAELGAGFEGPYIFATLPVTNMRGETPSPDSNSEIESYSSMTHSASEAYSNPVLHIVQQGVYRLKGTWNGQIWIDADESEDVAIILDGVNITCTVAPALVFHSAIECGPTENVVSFDVGKKMLGDDELSHAGAFIMIADGSTNNIRGANVYRILKADKKSSATKINGTDISDQKKMYKMDGAVYSFVSLVIGAESNRGGGRLNITSSTYEGLGSELHLLIDSGTITVNAEDDGINVNADNTSVFTMNGGSLKIVSKKGDGIDSNGYVVINNGTLDITAAQDSNQLNAEADGPIDAVLGVYMSDSVTYTHQAYVPGSDEGSSDNTDKESEENNNNNSNYTSDRKPVVIYGEDNTVVMRINYTTPVKNNSAFGRTIKGDDEVFILQQLVNSFSGITLKESN